VSRRVEIGLGWGEGPAKHLLKAAAGDSLSLIHAHEPLVGSSAKTRVYHTFDARYLASQRLGWMRVRPIVPQQLLDEGCRLFLFIRTASSMGKAACRWQTTATGW
jgi:hypothetical protein